MKITQSAIAKDLYPDYSDNNYFTISDYQPIIESFGTILLQIDDHDYQGDSRILYQKNNQIGYLQFGWGSCSGCDALQACENMQDVQNLIDNLALDIKWFDTPKQALEFFTSHDWEGDYSYYANEQKTFIEQSIQLLNNFKISIKDLATLKQDTKEGQKAILPIALKFLEDAGSPKKDILANVLIERAKAGLEKYPNVLQTDNGHISLVDVYQELCDAFMYSIQHVEEKKTNIYLPHKILDILEYVTDLLENNHEQI